MKKYLIKEETLTTANSVTRICPPPCGTCDPVFAAIEKVKALKVGDTIELDDMGLDNEVIYRLKLTEAPEGIQTAAEEPAAVEPEPEPTFYDKLRNTELAQNGSWVRGCRSQETLEKQHEDLVEVLAHARPVEAYDVLWKLHRGRVNGHKFNDGNGCGCLIGTLAMKRLGGRDALVTDDASTGCEVRLDAFKCMRLEGARGAMRPAEELFYSIEVGDKPKDNLSARLASQFTYELIMSNPKSFALRHHTRSTKTGRTARK